MFVFEKNAVNICDITGSFEKSNIAEVLSLFWQVVSICKFDYHVNDMYKNHVCFAHNSCLSRVDNINIYLGSFYTNK